MAKLNILKQLYGKAFRKVDEDFTKQQLAKIVRLNELKLSRTLSIVEKHDALRLLLNSCKRSIERVKDKSKITYYGKPHQFLDSEQKMAITLSKDKKIILDWLEQYIFFVDNERNEDFRPSLDRIIPLMGYVIGNIRVIILKNNRNPHSVVLN